MAQVPMNEASKRVHRLLTRLGLSLATAESCTGGWIAKLITDHSGSSTYFRGGAVVYTNAAKREFLGVKISDDEEAVTRRVAIAMAKNALRVFRSNLAISTTGYMEPPIGNSYVAVAFRRGARIKTRCEYLRLNGTRHQNRVSTSTAALHLIVKTISKGKDSK
jgi:nicotinamide-nucleotide amidase